MAMIFEIDDDDKVIFETSEELDEAFHDYMRTKKETSEEDNFATHEFDTLTLLSKVCGDHPFIRNMINYYLSLPQETRIKIWNDLSWKQLNANKIMRDFMAAIQDVTKK